MDKETITAIIIKEREIGKAPTWLLDALERTSDAVDEGVLTNDEKTSTQLSEFIYPH